MSFILVAAQRAQSKALTFNGQPIDEDIKELVKNYALWGAIKV